MSNQQIQQIQQIPYPTKKPSSLRKGTIMKGNDGNLWKVVTQQKIKQWKKFTNYQFIDNSSIDNIRSTRKCKTNSYISNNNVTPKKYKVHDNGGRPFLVVIEKNEINVFTHGENNDENNDEDYNYTIHILTIVNFLGYWNGYHPANPTDTRFMGNSILVQLNPHKYIFIGKNIYMFSTFDIIYDYYSEVGNSNVPYPVALGEDNTYYMLDCKYLTNNQIPIVIQPLELYSYYYGHITVPNDPLLLNVKKNTDPRNFAVGMTDLEILQDRRW